MSFDDATDTPVDRSFAGNDSSDGRHHHTPASLDRGVSERRVDASENSDSQKYNESSGSQGAQSKDSDDKHDHADAKDDKDGDDKKDGDDHEAGKPRSKKPLIILAIVVLILAIAGFIAWFVTRNQESTDDAYTDGNTVTMVPKISGYVVELLINDNQHVRKGDLLLRIDPRDYQNAKAQAEAQLILAQAQLASAQQSYEIAQVQYPAQLESAKAQQQSADASLRQARQSYERQHAVDRRATTQENIDQADTQQASGIAGVRSARAQVTIASVVPQQLELAATTVAQRQADVAQAQASLDQADLNLSYTEVRAPQDGFVTRRNVQLGTFLTAGQVMFVLVTNDIWVTANFKESQIGRMRPGDNVDMKVDAYHGLSLSGHIQSIQYGSGSRFSTFPAENATGNFVKIVQRVPVKIVIDQGLDPNQPLPIGLSVSPTVHFP